jgi:hypothetical protein
MLSSIRPASYAHGSSAELLHAVLKAGHRWDDEERWALVIYVHGDVSGKEGIIASGCYLGREEHWQKASEAWERINADAGVPYFHATDFFNTADLWDDTKWRYEHPTKGIIPGSPEHVAFAKRYSAVAEDAGLVGFAFGMRVSVFTELLQPIFAREKRGVLCTDPQMFAIMRSVAQVSQFLDATQTPAFELGRGQVIFEEEVGVSGAWTNLFVESRQRREAWTKWFATLTTAPKEVVPVQIADLLAHEAWRRLKTALGEESYPLRKSFERMLVNERIEVQVLTPEDAQKNAAMFNDLIERFPNGLVPDLRPLERPRASVAESAAVSWAHTGERGPKR